MMVNKRTKQRALAISAAMLSFTLLAGCSGSLQDRAEKAVSNATVAIEDTVTNAADHLSDKVRENSISKELTSVKQEAGTAKIFQMSNPVGAIKVKPSAGKEITVKTTIWSPNKPFHKDKQQQIFDQAVVSVIVSGDQVEVLAHAKDQPDQDLWSWAESKYGFSDFSIDYEIELPASVNIYEVNNDVGELTLSQLSGTYNVKSSVGSIVIEDAHINGASSVSAGTGSVQLGIAQMDADSSLSATTEVGSIKAALAKSLSCDLETSSDIGEISGAPEGKSERNGGGPLLSLSSAVGSITVGE